MYCTMGVRGGGGGTTSLRYTSKSLLNVTFSIIHKSLSWGHNTKRKFSEI